MLALISSLIMQKRYKAPEKRLRLNNQIRVPEISVIDDTGKQLGIMPVHEALKIADTKGLDLVEIGPTAKPPLAKIMNFGKYMYQKEKKGQNSKGKSAANEMKTVRLGFRTEIHDIMVRASQADKFLKKGHRVMLQVTMRGKEREMAHLAREKLEKSLTMISELFVKESEIKRYPGGFEVLIRPER